MVSGWKTAGAGAFPIRQHANLSRQCGWKRSAAFVEKQSHRYRAPIFSGWAMDLLHQRPRRNAANLPDVEPGEARAGGAQRVTFNGGYNTTPRISPDGRLLAYISRAGGAYRLLIRDLQSGETAALTQTQRDEAPSFAANSQYILYATHLNGRSVLAIVS